MYKTSIPNCFESECSQFYYAIGFNTKIFFSKICEWSSLETLQPSFTTDQGVHQFCPHSTESRVVMKILDLWFCWWNTTIGTVITIGHLWEHSCMGWPLLCLECVFPGWTRSIMLTFFHAFFDLHDHLVHLGDLEKYPAFWRLIISLEHFFSKPGMMPECQFYQI